MRTFNSFQNFYFSLNGVPACANQKLLTDILRKEWNFTGYVVTDDDALLFAVSEHHYFPSNVESAAGAIKAGCNLELADTSPWAFASLPEVGWFIVSIHYFNGVLSLI